MFRVASMHTTLALCLRPHASKPPGLCVFMASYRVIGNTTGLESVGSQATGSRIKLRISYMRSRAIRSGLPVVRPSAPVLSAVHV